MDLLALAREATAAKDWPTAANYWRQYLAQEPLQNERDAVAALRVFVLTKQMDEAKKVGMFARKAYPESVSVLRLFIQVMVASKHWLKVMELSQQVFKLLETPALADDVSFLSALIQFIRRNPVERAEVLGYFDQAMRHHGRHYRLVSIKARYFEIVHDYPAACHEWQYLSEQHLDEMTMFNWGEYVRVLHASGLFEQAKQQLAMAQARFPDSKELAAEQKKNDILNQTTYQVLAEDPMYKVTYFKQKQPTDVMFITFGTAPTTITSIPFGQDFLLKQGFDLIYVAQAVRTQYQGLSIEAFYEAVKAVIPDKRVFTYGSSLGAYCAIYFAGCIDATAISAGCRNPCDPCLKKYPNIDVGPHQFEPYHHRPIKDNPISSKPPFVLFDPTYKVDVTMFEEQILPAYPNAHVWKVPHASHPSLHLLLELGVLKDFVLTIVRENRFIDQHLPFESSALWHYERADWLAREQQDVSGAIEHLRRSLAIKKRSDAYILLVKLLAQQGQHAEAVAKRLEGLQHFAKHKGLLMLKVTPPQVA